MLSTNLTRVSHGEVYGPFDVMAPRFLSGVTPLIERGGKDVQEKRLHTHSVGRPRIWHLSP